ncbi:A-kinase anchor protein 7-like isoform X6 [Ostrea edulis]|uniref:A-kinase anchor protein 7-like isoform X6 n=1 Tax=Ostrea edulis TaxID=37623 RepID=UPI0024AEAEEB|nr:A-kinase anchor protein 7-like isoform X6 [Ostrea edulis]
MVCAECQIWLLMTTGKKGKQEIQDGMMAGDSPQTTFWPYKLPRKRAAESLNRFHDKLKVSDFAPPSFTVSTLGNFNHKVVFASFADDQGLKDLNTLARDVKKSLEDDGLFTTDDKFNPHITICKMSRDMPRLRRLGIKRIEPSHYEEKKYTYFGKQTAGGIQLCSMVEPRSESGYYHIEHEIKF